MGPRGLERRFDRFRRTGDAAALAAVFDALAPELLRVASHLASDAAAAEDLLQRTFLTAIEAASTWDHRGIERARRTVPGAFQSLGAVGLVPLRGLEAIRRVVVARAQEAGPALVAASAAAAAAVVGGAVMGKKAIVAAAVLLVLGGGGTAVLVGTGRPAAVGEPGPRSALAPSADAPRLESVSSGTEAARARSLAPADPDPTKGTVEVRILTSDGRVLADEPFVLVPGGNPARLSYRHGRTGPAGSGPCRT